MLLHARVLVCPLAERARRRRASREIAAARTQLRESGYAVLRALVPPAMLAGLRAYARALDDEGYLVHARTDRHARRCRHDDPIFAFVHRQTGALMRSLTREAVVPSYSFLSAYRENAELLRHRDRAACVWNGSLLVDVFGPAEWPLYVTSDGANRRIDLALGDLCVYSGTKTEHWRPRIAPGSRQTLALFHYVPLDFTGSLR
jgi:hypothetical protein